MVRHGGQEDLWPVSAWVAGFIPEDKSQAFKPVGGLKNQLEEGAQDRGILGGFWGRDIRKDWGLRPKYLVTSPPRIPPRFRCPGVLPPTGFTVLQLA